MLHENISRQNFEIFHNSFQKLGLKDRTFRRERGGGVDPDLSLAVISMISRQQKLALEVLHGITSPLRLIKDQKQRGKL